MIAPEQNRLTQLLDELATRTDGSTPSDRLDRVHGRARRTTRVRVLSAAAAAAIVVAAAGVVLTRGLDLASPVPPTATTPAVQPTPHSNTPTPPQKTPTASPRPSGHSTLVPADSRFPAAGSCAFASGAVVTVLANPDVPMPRCLSIHPGQQLRIVNNSAALGSPALTITVRWANYDPRVLKPGEATTFRAPAGSYLAVGVHRAILAPLYGGQGAAEIWLH